jgi:hypothetical protein
MKELWSRTFELFRRHIVIGVPCWTAGIGMLALGRIQKVELRRLFTFFATWRSVLGGEAPVADLAQAQHRALMLSIPLGFVKDFLEVFLFVVALVATKNLVYIFLDERRPDTIAVLQGIRPRMREVLVLSLKYIAVVGILGGVLVVLGSFPLIPERIHEIALSHVFFYVFSLGGQACIAWLLLPASIRLLKPPEGPTVSIRIRRLGTAFAVAATASVLMLDYLVSKGESVMILEAQWERDALSAVNTVIFNTPEALLFIALALLALERSDAEELLASDPGVNWANRFADWVRKARDWKGSAI